MISMLYDVRDLLNGFAGNFFDIFNKDGYAFHRNIVKEYGGVVKLSALFGVRCASGLPPIF